jgi:hypothetical protein
MMGWKHVSTRAAAILLAFALPAAAGAISVQQVIDDGGFTTSNGITFSNFSVSITGALAGSLTAADLELTFEESAGSAGFSLTAPISAADGEVGDVFLSFSVTSAGPAIIGALLSSLNVADGGLGALASVDELIRGSGGALLGVLSTSDTGGPGAGIFDDDLSFAAQTTIRVMKDILVDSSLLGGGSGGSARISFVSQTFVLVPEPATLLLVAGGVAALGWRRRSRAR